MTWIESFFIIIIIILFGMTAVMCQRFHVVNCQLEVIKIEIKQIYNDLIFEE